jgi:polyisoprenoid-binding protein YceI
MARIATPARDPRQRNIVNTPAPTERTDPTEPGKPRRRRWRWTVSALAVVVIGIGAFLWWFFRDDAPDSVSLGAAAAQVQGADAQAGAVVTAQSPATETAAATAAVDSAATGVAGTWSVDTSIGEFSYEDSTGTFVGFRVEEELTGIGSTTAVGRTPEVSGTLTIEGTTVTAVTLEADMTAITTNESRRDDKVQRALDTGEFPTATFVLTEPIELGDAAASGKSVSVTATGDLTVHGVTTPVTLPLGAQLVGDNIVVVGSLDIVFADYGVSVPSAPVVLSAEDEGVLELQLFFSTA